MTANSLIDRKQPKEAPKPAAPERGVHALLAKLDAPIAKYPLRVMFASAVIGLPLLLAAGFFHLRFEEGRAGGHAMAWWEGQGMTLGFICLSIAATPPAYVFARTFVKAKLMAFIACLLGGVLPLPFLLGRWVEEGKFGLTAACVAAALLLTFVILARDAATNRRLALAALAVATIAIVLAFGASGALSLWLPLGAVAWLALPTIAMKVLNAD
ncbi:MAG: hypothetical protein U0232_21135 [Thermomicrobiales bacterium]